MDIYLSGFDVCFGIVWCLCGWLGGKIAKKVDHESGVKTDWEGHLLALLFGPVGLLCFGYEFLKRKKRAKNPNIGGHYNDIFAWLDRFFEH